MKFVQEITALQGKVGDNADATRRIEAKVDSLLERLSKLEVAFEYMKQNTKHEISADLKSDFAQIKVVLDLYEQGRLLPPK